MDFSKQVNYWTIRSEEDFAAAAQSLLEKGHYRHSFFFSHLALEKILKAHVTMKINDVPPKIHNLIRLSDIDLIVIAPEFDGKKDVSLVKTLWRATVADNRIEPIPCGEKEWETDESRPIREIARKEGIVIQK